MRVIFWSCAAILVYIYIGYPLLLWVARRVRGYRDRGVRLLRLSERQGKTLGLNQAVPEARGDIIVFSDANALYEAGAIRQLSANFADPGVGYVTGASHYQERGTSSAGCSGSSGGPGPGPGLDLVVV